MTHVILSYVCAIPKIDGGKFVLEKNPSPPTLQKDIHDAQVLMTDTLTHSRDLVDIILSRRSVRRYQQKEIPKDVLRKILEAGRQAPSAMNRQPWHFIVVTNNEVKRELSRWHFTKHIKNSPVTIVGCAKTGLLDRKWSIIGTSIALQNMVIAAWALGIGSCWIGGFKEGQVKQLLKIPDKWKIVALVTLGYPDETPHLKRKKPIEKVFSINKF